MKSAPLLFITGAQRFLAVTTFKCFSATQVWSCEQTLESLFRLSPPAQKEPVNYVYTDPLQKVDQLLLAAKKLLLAEDGLKEGNEKINEAFKLCTKEQESLQSCEKTRSFNITSTLAKVWTLVAAYRQKNKQPVEAISAYQQALTLHKQVIPGEFDHSHWPYYFNLILGHLFIEDTERALSLYKLRSRILLDDKVLVRRLQVDEYRTNCAVIASLKGETELAIELSSSALSHLPETPNLGAAILHFNLTQFHTRLHDKQRAEESAQLASEYFSKLVKHPIDPFIEILTRDFPYSTETGHLSQANSRARP